MHPHPNEPDLDSVPRIRVWLELGGNDGTGLVEVGQPTTMNVRAILPGSVGIRIVDCAALDGLGESSQKLLDDRGCPVDEQVSRMQFTPKLCKNSTRIDIIDQKQLTTVSHKH